MLSNIKYIINEVIKFLLCLISSACEYSLTKFLAYFFTLLIFYLVIFTDKDYGELLIFLGVLLGVRHFDKKNYYQNTPVMLENEVIEEIPYNKVSGFNYKNQEEKG